ncbi:GDSL family lipase [Noviherbaspirillum sp. L7-7A]|nr:GDSL family lipase [Noviherbaspirillum sp. L7-7A]
MLAAAASVGGSTMQNLRHAARLSRLSRPFHASPEAAEASVLIVGDSTALGTGASTPQASLAGRIAARYPSLRIRNLARAGARFADIAEQLRDVGQHDLILVAGGANDVMRFTSESRLARDIDLTLHRAASQAGRVILLPAPNVGNAPFFPRPLSWLLSYRARLLHRLARASAGTVGAAYVDLYREHAADPFAQDPQRLIAADRLHPSDAGYAVWFDELERQAPLAGLLDVSIGKKGQTAWPGDLKSVSSQQSCRLSWRRI